MIQGLVTNSILIPRGQRLVNKDSQECNMQYIDLL
mgnify:CR=1 FL=1